MACFGIKEKKELWDYAKETYLKQPGPRGYPDFKELTTKLSDDIFRATGGTIQNGQRVGGTFLVPEEVAKLLAGTKSLTRQRNTLLMSDVNRNSMLRQARDFVTGQEKTPFSRFIKTAYETPYAAKVIGHGPALHMTHAWPLFFDPAAWRTFGKTWVDSWKAMKPSNARAMEEGIMLGPRFDQKVRSGLAIDPRKVYDDIQNRAEYWGKYLGPKMGGYAAKVFEATSKSFLGLKGLRDGWWDQIYDTVPDHLRTKEMEELISLQVNHMTGAPGTEGARMMSSKGGQAARVIMFAPSLDIARIMRPVDLIKHLGIESRTQLNKLPVVGEKLREAWGQASPEQQWIARYNMKQWARIGGVFSALLYTNHLALKHLFGREDKDNVNITDPFKGDWMAPKGPNGQVWQATGGQVPLTRAVTKSVMAPSKAGESIGNYLIGKLNPAISVVKGAATGKAFGGAQLPAPLGTEPATVGNWLEYATAELGPIATEEGIHEFSKMMKDQTGVPEAWHTKFLKSVVKAGLVTIPSAGGTHLYEPLKKENKEKLKPAIQR